MKEFFVADASRFENQLVTSFFCVASLTLRERRGGDGKYLALTLADRTGELEARMWDEFAGLLNSCSQGCYVKVQGQISRYNGRFQITLTRMRPAAEEEIEKADFIPSTRFDVGQMAAELQSYIEAIREPHLRRLLLAFYDDPELGPELRLAPAAKKLHHAWLGGLLEHTLDLVRVCRAVSPFYPEVDPDLVVAGAMLHDLGKVRELSWNSTFEYTLEGQLVGHITIAQRMLAEKIAILDAETMAAARGDGGPAEPGSGETSSGEAGSGSAGSERFPVALRLLLEHMILSHHGRLEFGSPKLPMTPEALLLSALDDLEAKFQTLRNAFASARDSGRGPDQTTEWVRSMDRNLFDSRAYLAEVRSKDASATPGEDLGEGMDGTKVESPASAHVEVVAAPANHADEAAGPQL